MSAREKTRGLTANATSASAAAAKAVLLEAVAGPGKGARLVLEAGIATIGSDTDCDLTLDDPTVSRRHATAELRGASVRFRDLGSRNGVSYLGAKVADARVPVGGSVKLGKTSLKVSTVSEAAQPSSERDALGPLLGSSPPMRRLYAQLEKLGPSEVPVLIGGETGSGKDAVARALHALSGRAGKSFVVFDCAAVSPQLVESELFGHAKGAFSGADAARTGALEAAHGGTLFLDEVGELPLDLQPKLLRVLEGHELRRVGENQVRKVSVRVLSATHRDLAVEVREGRFRQDLFFRLAGASVEVPALRQRREDIPVLAAHFARESSGLDVTLSPATLAALQCEEWPGNVRELRNAVQRALALGDAPAPAAPDVAAAPSYKEARDGLLATFERDYLSALLKRHRGNVSAAARGAKLSRSTFYEMLERHGLARGGQTL